MGRLVFLDEAKTEAKTHGQPVLSVGGVSAEQEDVPQIEELWRQSKARLGLGGTDLRYAMSWPGGADQRLQMIETISTLSLKNGVVALLEDHRPPELMQSDRTRRKDLYVHSGCFDYVLQRLRAPQYRPGDGAHLILFDHGDHFQELDRRYRAQHDRRRLPWNEEWPSLRDLGYSESLAAAGGGPLNEVADLLVGTVTRWAACRCGMERGMELATAAELERECRAVLDLFPTSNSIPPRWTGWSFVVFKEPRTKGRQLKAGLDRWLLELRAAPTLGA